MAISRKEFLKIGSLASASMMVPGFLKAFEFSPKPEPGKKSLIIIQLSGGNDGLNTIIPYRNDIYYRTRPQIKITPDKVLTLNDEIGLNPYLKGIKELYDKGEVCLINGVGYPQPNRSHFRSMDIWQSGSSSSEVLNSGWIGRHLDIDCGACNAHNLQALEIDDSLSLAMKGETRNAIAIRDITTQ